MRSATSPLHRALGLLVLSAVPVGSLGCAGEAQETDGPEPIGEAVSAASVNQAANNSCSTLSVKGLSLQIIAQANCIAPGAFVKVPDLGNLSMTSTVFPYLEEPARDALVATLNANPGTSMQVNSMLRTVAQQYLLYHWYKNGQCGIGLAATPGNSNHETGLALDVQQYNTWKGPLQNHGFKWFGNADPVHFDYNGAGAQSYKGTDVLAFQILWNKNHPNDMIAEDGDYGPQTESRLQQAPADGFANGPSCAAPSQQPDIHPSVRVVGATDRFTDASSMGKPDLFEGETYEVELEITNKGAAGVGDVEVGIWIEEPFLVAGDYLIESDWQHQGTFEENDANTADGNPPHDGAPGQTFTLKMNGMSPDETKRITLAVTAAEYSIGLADAPDVRFWVKDVPGFYHQDEFGGASDNVDGSQTFNGGKLQVHAATDVYSHTRWEWNSDLLEGWSAVGDATLAADPGAEAMLIGGEGDDPGALGPETAFAAAEVTGVTLGIKRTGGVGEARLYFATEDDPVMDEAKSVAFEVADDEALHEVVVDVASSSRWSGVITALRVDPFESGPGTAELSYLRAGGVPGDGPTGGFTSGGADDGETPGAVNGSCACSAAGGPVGNAQGLGPALLLGLFALGLRSRARRPRAP